MSTTVYIPAPNEGLGGSIGNALGAYAARSIDKNEREQRMAEVQKQEEAILRAPDRATALELFNKIKFADIQQQQQALQWLDKAHPVADTTPREVTSYDPVTGQEGKRFVPQNKLTGEGTTKPDVAQFFQPVDESKGIYTDLGHAPMSNRPPGAVTKEELDLREKARDNDRQAATQRNTDLADTIATTKQFYNSVVNLLPANVKKVAADGSFSVDFTENPKLAVAFRKTLTQQDELLSQHGGNFNKAAMAGLESQGAFDKPPVEAQAAPAAPKAGIVDSLKAAFAPAKKSAAPAKAATSEAKPTAFIKGKTYVDAKGNKAKYGGKDSKGKDIWE